MSTEVKVKKEYPAENVVRETLTRCLDVALANESLHDAPRKYLERLKEKNAQGKHLTSNEVAGLSKIERALQHVAKGTYTVKE
jgi:GTP cyclohydrolase I